MAGGSDAPIETCSPLVGMFDAIHRQARSSAVSEGEDVEARSDSQAADTSPSLNAAGEHDSPESEIFRPEERLSFAEALWIYTVGAALAAGCEHFLGSLETGYAADFVILDVAVLDQHALLQTTEPLLVVVGGSESYRKTTGSEGVGTLTDISTEEGRSAATMGGPYIPGKNGPRPSKRRQKRVDADADGALGPVCACRLLGKYCSVVYR